LGQASLPTNLGFALAAALAVADHATAIFPVPSLVSALLGAKVVLTNPDGV